MSDGKKIERRCPSCEAVLPASAPMGLCVRCLLQAGMAQKVVPTDSEPTKPSDSTAGGRAGEHIGPYKLLEQIGEGGMGTVWMAEQSEPILRKVALKVIKEGMDSRQVLARFEAERQALAMMDHPNIAKVLDAGSTSDGRPFFVMELVKGVPLTNFCDEGCLTIQLRLELFILVCQAIQHTHQKGIIHRDIKPSNVLVALSDGVPVPKVIDFGVAKAIGHQLTEKTLFTNFGAVVGTLEYMSPEQAELNQLDLDMRSDIYSLGVLLYELLTGTTPLTREFLSGATFDEVLRCIREEDAPRPSTRLSESRQRLPAISIQRQLEPSTLPKLLRGDLDCIVMRALHKDRLSRYQDAAELVDDLKAYLAGHPLKQPNHKPPRLYTFGKALDRNRVLQKASSALFTANLLILGICVLSVILLTADARFDLGLFGPYGAGGINLWGALQMNLIGGGIHFVAARHSRKIADLSTYHALVTALCIVVLAVWAWSILTGLCPYNAGRLLENDRFRKMFSLVYVTVYSAMFATALLALLGCYLVRKHGRSALLSMPRASRK